MIYLALALHVLLFIILLKLTDFKKNYFNPVYFLLYANYFYFFIFWIVWIFVDQEYVYKYQLGYYLTLLHGFGLVAGVVYAQKTNHNLLLVGLKVFPKSKFEYFKARSLFILFLSFSMIIIYITYDTYGTFNPIEILVEIESTRQSGFQYTSGLSYYIKPIKTFLVLIFCFLVFLSYKEKKTYFIWISILIFIVMSLALGSKSMVIFPIFYTFMIRHNFFKKLPLKNIIISGMLVLLFIPFLELVRQGMTDRLDNAFSSIFQTLVGRINMQLYLTKFFDIGYSNMEYPNSLYHFFTYFIPRSLMEYIGIYDKPIPFGLEYTRYVTQRPDVYMTVAGGAIAEWIHNFAIFGNIWIVYFGIVLGGFVSGLFNGILFKFIQLSIEKQYISKFILILIFIHIGTFFEFGFSVSIGTLETIFTLIFLILISNIFLLKRNIRINV